MWQGRFNRDIESIGNTLGSLKESQEQVGLHLAFLFSWGGNEMNGRDAVVLTFQHKTMLRV